MPDLTLIKVLSELPESIEEAIIESQNSGVAPLAYCSADTSDCSTDGESCTSDCSCDSHCSDCSCNTHCSDCSCNTHCSDCSCNTHCNDCNDCSSDYSGAYVEYVSSSNQAIRLKVYGAAGATISYKATPTSGGTSISGSVSAGTASSKSFSITGLAAGTEYKIEIRVAGTLIDTLYESTTGICSDCTDCSDCSSDCSSDGVTSYGGEIIQVSSGTTTASVAFSVDQACVWRVSISTGVMVDDNVASATGSLSKSQDYSTQLSGLSSGTTYVAILYVGESITSLSRVDYKTFTTESSCSDCVDCSDSVSTADFSYTYTESDITVKITGIKSGDQLYIVVRPTDDADGYVFSTGPYSATSTTFTKTVTGCLEAGTDYTINVSVNGTWLGAETFTTPGGDRPANWSWSTVGEEGDEIAITAADWNAFCDRINEFREYKSLSAYSFTTAVKGKIIEASTVNQAYTAILAISGHGTLPTKAASGEAITASFFQMLKTALNTIT